MLFSEVCLALNRKLFHISDHRVVRQLVESLTEVALKLVMHETSIRDLVEKVPVVRFASIAGKSIYWMVPGFFFTATVAAKALWLVHQHVRRRKLNRRLTLRPCASSGA